VASEVSQGADPQSRFLALAIPAVGVFVSWVLVDPYSGHCDSSGWFPERRIAVLCLVLAATWFARIKHERRWSWSGFAIAGLAGGGFLVVYVHVSTLLSGSWPPGGAALAFYSLIAAFWGAVSPSLAAAALVGFALLLAQVLVDVAAHVWWMCVV
jgi:hypothetical protein